MDSMTATDEMSAKVVDKICRIIDELMVTSKAFKVSDASHNESVRKLETNVDLLTGVIKDVNSGALDNKKL
jgi:Na+/phosphate symporter